MKYFFFVFSLTSLAFANNYGCTENAAGVIPNYEGSDAITLSVINDWIVADVILGLDVFESTGELWIFAVNESNDWVRAYSGTTGAIGSTLNLDGLNIACFGIAWNNDATDDTYYTNDMNLTQLFFTDDFGSTWTNVPNPAGNDGRGMDFDGTDYWITNGVGGELWRFQPGVGSQNIATPEVPTEPSGLTVFPYGSNLGLAVTTYNTHNIYFYEWNGSTMSYLGFGECPASNIYYSLGLAYADTNGDIYWSYLDNTLWDYHLVELSFDIMALEHTSWGAIKSIF